MRAKLAIAAFISSILFFGCQPEETFPDEPEVKLESIERAAADSIMLTLSFTDGDGNFGLNDGDDSEPNLCGTCPFHFNLFLDYYERVEGGEFTLVEPPSPYHRRIPWIIPTGQNPSQKGIIEYGINDFFIPDPDLVEIQYRVRIVDRDFQVSNEIVVGPIAVGS